MSIAENKALVRQFVEEVLNNRDLDAANRLLDVNYVEHAGAPGLPPNREGFKQLLVAFGPAFPDMRVTIEDMVGEGEKVVGRFTGRGTHTGEFFGIPATGKRVTYTATNTYRIVDGRIIERWGNSDDLGLMQQIGAIPSMG